MIDLTSRFYFAIVLLVVVEGRSPSPNTHRQFHPRGESNAPQQPVPPDHPCVQGYPCRNRGRCVPQQDSSNQYTSDYSCECYKQYYTVDPNDNKVCKQNIYHCKEANIKCQNDGKCLDTWGNFYCKCQPGWGGRFCEIPFKEARVNLPMVLFDPDAFTGHKHHLLVVLKYPITGFNLSFSYGTKEGRLNPTNMEWRNEPITPYVNLFDENTIRLVLKGVGKTPTRFMLFSHVFTAKNEEENLYISLSNGNAVVQFEGNYKIKVNSNPSECVPTASIQDCGGPESIPNFRRRDLRILRGRAVKDCPEYKSSLHYTWTLYDVAQRNLPFDDGPWKNVIKHYAIQEEEQEYVIPQFSLPFGKYALRLRVDERVAGVKRRRSHLNTAVCFFMIIPESLIPKIEGGDVRNVGNNIALILNATASYDPNEGRTSKQSLTYMWSCENQGGPGLSLCKGLNHVFSTDMIYTILEKELKSGSTVTFLLVIGRKDNSLPAVNTTQLVRIYDGVLPIIKVVPALNCEEGKKANPEQMTAFYVSCSYHCNNSWVSGFYKWSVTGSAPLDWDTQIMTPDDEDNVVILKDTLEPGGTYQFNVKGGMDVHKAETSFTLKVNIKPVKGVCTIHPQSGYEGLSIFVTNCSGFSDEEQWPIMYEIFQSQTPLESDYDVDFGDLISYDTMPRQTLTLSRGLGPNYETTISILAKDVYDMAAVVQLNVEAKPVKELGRVSLLEIIHRALSGDDPLSLPSLIEGGDLSGAVRTVGALSDVLAADSNISLTEKTEMKKQLIAALKKSPTNRIHAIIQVSNALEKVVSNDESALDYSGARETLELAKGVGESLANPFLTGLTSTDDLTSTVT